MKAIKFLGAAVVLAGAVGAASSAKADPIFLGYSINGGAITPLGSSTTGQAGGSTTTGGFAIQASATGSPVLAEPNLLSNTISVSSSTAGTIAVYASELGLSTPSNYSVSFSNNQGNTFSSLTEAFSTATGAGANTPFTTTGPGTTTTSAALAPGGGSTVLAPYAGSTPYSITEMFTITFGVGGGFVNATIDERGSSIPEPVSLSLLGASLAGLGLLGRLRRRA